MAPSRNGNHRSRRRNVVDDQKRSRGGGREKLPWIHFQVWPTLGEWGRMVGHMGRRWDIRMEAKLGGRSSELKKRFWRWRRVWEEASVKGTKFSCDVLGLGLGWACPVYDIKHCSLLVLAVAYQCNRGSTSDAWYHCTQ